MLFLHIGERELFDENKGEFVMIKAQTLQLEHSLVSVSKWEAKWKKSFLSNSNRTVEETIDYIRCMTITQNVNPLVYTSLTDEDIKTVYNYMNDSMTATTISDKNGKKGTESITSELIYYWMVALNIPFECQKWHLNRLITLIRVCDAKSAPPKKMGRRSIMSQNAALNRARRKRLNSRG